MTLRENAFRQWMTARFFYTFAVQMQAVVLGWLMYDLTKDPLQLGLIGLTEAVPALGLALFAGYIVDRSQPLWIYRGVIAVSLISGVILWVAILPAANWSVSAQVALLYSASFLTGLARGFSQPAVFAIVPRIVPREKLSQASAWMATSMQIARISGPAVGGVVFAWFGSMAAAVIICLLLIAAQVVMAGLGLSVEAPLTRRGQGPIRQELLSGVAFVWHHPILLPALTLDMVSVLFGGVTALLPIYASEILQVGAQGLGALRAAPAIGAAISGFWLVKRDFRAHAGSFLFLAVGGFGVCILVFALSQDFLLSLAALALSGAFDSVSMIIRSAAVQLASPDDMRGRISAVNSIFIGSSNELGELESGVAAKLLGVVPAAVFGAVACLATVGLTAILSPSLRQLDLRKLENGSNEP